MMTLAYLIWDRVPGPLWIKVTVLLLLLVIAILLFLEIAAPIMSSWVFPEVDPTLTSGMG